MSLDVFWAVLRTINFFILFAAFMVMIYKGVFKLILDRTNFQWDRLLNLLWVTVMMVALAESLLQWNPGGIRTVMTFFVASLQLYVSVFFFKMRPQVDER